MTIQENLKTGVELLQKNKVESPSLKCRVLLSHLLKKPKEYLIINEKENLDKMVQKKYEQMLKKLVQNIPLQYITNKQEFMGLTFYVDENVLIPRCDTEILVEEVIKRVNKNDELKILDVCTGSGAVGIALAKYIQNSKVTASDISKSALEVAKKNAIINKVKIEFIESNLFENIYERFDIIVSNPPYIETDTISILEEQVKREPKIALDGGEDGLKFYTLIAKESKQYLNSNGMIAVEIGYNQKNKVKKIFEKEQYSKSICIKDLGGNDRVVICHKK